MSYKLIALDLDGTLNNSERKITPKTKEALIKAQEHGVRVALVSGRPAPGLVREANELNLKEHNGLLVSFNGAKVVDATTGECVYEKTLELDQAKRVLNYIKDLKVCAMINKGDYCLTTDINGYMVDYETSANNLKPMEVKDLRDTIDFKPCKILISAEPEYLSTVVDKIKEPFEGELSIYFSAPYFLEVVSNGIDKGSTLKELCPRLGITEKEIMAFGDERNDLTMLTVAGLGVAMGNANEEVKAIADKITLSNDEDGIAHTLKEIFDFI